MKIINTIIAVILVIIAFPLTLIYTLHKIANRISEAAYDNSPFEKSKK